MDPVHVVAHGRVDGGEAPGALLGTVAEQTNQGPAAVTLVPRSQGTPGVTRADGTAPAAVTD